MGDSIRVIGNIMEDKWFDIEEHFKPKESNDDNNEVIYADNEPLIPRYERGIYLKKHELD